MALNEAVSAQSNEAIPAAPSCLLELYNIGRAYGSGDTRSVVLKDVGLRICAGEMIAIIGASGSGKSTLLNILGCLDHPTTGWYKINGQDVTYLPANALSALRREYFGFIFQRYHLLNQLTAEENVEVPALYTRHDRLSRRQRAVDLLQRFGLANRTTYRPNQLSGGQQQRVGIARALMNGGEIILADEPTGALDAKSGAEVLAILRGLNRRGHTVIIVTHDRQVAAHAQRIVEINDGAIVADYVNPDRIAIASVNLADEVPARDAQITLDPDVQVRHYNKWLAQVEAVKMAAASIIRQPLRTILTMLGIVVGIAAVSTVVALGQGAQDQIVAEIKEMGSNTIDIFPGGDWGDAGSAAIQTLVASDVELLKAQPYIDSVSPIVTTSVLMRVGEVVATGQLTGVSSDFFRLRQRKILSGFIFSADQVTRHAQVLVIDENTRNKLFKKGDNPIGKQMMVGSMPVTVIAVVNNSNRGNSASLEVLAPYTTVASHILGRSYFDNIVIRVAEGISNPLAEKNMVRILSVKHGIKDFFTSSFDSILKTIEKATQTMRLFILCVAAISLFVGGIGLMNMMLVVVTERTHEIGVRMALGARQRDIMWQFLAEAVLVCTLGGVLGLVLAMAAGGVLTIFFASIPLRFSGLSLLVALLTSTLVGVTFGYFPARNAARLNPVDALARE